MSDTPTSSQGPAAVVNQLKELWGKQSKGRRLAAALVVVGIIGIVLVSRLMNTTVSWAVVADGASPDDASEMIAVLEQRGLGARLTAGKVEVKSTDLEKARVITAAAGLPRTGKGFELFDGNHLGQSSFAEQVNFRRGLQGELARSITSLAQVQGARVHLALGKRSVFKDQQEAATASVALQLHPGQQLAAEQVRGIRQMVAASVEGLRPDAVVVVDNHGNLLDAEDPSGATKSAAIEQGVTSRVRGMLEKVVGKGKVNVVTTAVIDDRQVSETQELFDNTNPVLRSESRVVEGAGALDPTTLNSVGGVAGTRGNLPGATPAGGAAGAAPAAGGAGGANGRLQETKNFEISRTVRQVKKPDAQLSKLYLAVVVDFAAGPDGKPVARTEKEMAELTAIARQAAGIDDARGDKIDVRAVQFVPETDTEIVPEAPKPTGLAALLPVPLEVAGAALGGFVILVIAGIFLLKGRKKKSKLADVKKPVSLALPAPVADLERALEAKQHGETLALDTSVSSIAAPAQLPGSQTRDRVLTAVRSDVDRAAEVLTAWLSEPPVKSHSVAAKGK